MAKVQPKTSAGAVAQASAKDQAAKDAAKAAKKAARKRVDFSLVGSKDPKVYPFVSVNGVATPSGFDRAKNKALKAKDFASKSDFFLYRAEQAEADAANYRKLSTDEAQVGDKATRNKVKKLQKFVSQAEELKKMLQAQGIDITKLLSNVQAVQDAAAEAPAVPA